MIVDLFFGVMDLDQINGDFMLISRVVELGSVFRTLEVIIHHS